MLTSTRLGSLLGIRYQEINRLADIGVIPHQKVGNRYAFPDNDIEKISKKIKEYKEKKEMKKKVSYNGAEYEVLDPNNISVKELSEIIGLSREAIYGRVDRNTIKHHYNPLGRVSFMAENLEKIKINK